MLKPATAVSSATECMLSFPSSQPGVIRFCPALRRLVGKLTDPLRFRFPSAPCLCSVAVASHRHCRCPASLSSAMNETSNGSPNFAAYLNHSCVYSVTSDIRSPFIQASRDFNPHQYVNGHSWALTKSPEGTKRMVVGVRKMPGYLALG